MKIGVFGPQGSGKTTIAMFFARYFISQDSRIKVYTNIIAPEENQQIVTIEDLADIPYQDGLPKIVIVDEAYFSIGARESNSQQNKIWTKAHALFRKSDIVLTMFVTHAPNMIDVNIRNLLEFIIMSRKNKHYFDFMLYDTLSRESAPLQLPRAKQLFDFTNFDTKQFPDPITVEQLKTHPLFKIQK